MNGRSQDQVVALGERLTDNEQSLLRDVARLRLVSHRQLAALLDPSDPAAAPATAARSARRVLARLHGDGLLTRLERRVGGVRAGSAGYVYYLGPVGQRLLAYWAGEGVTRGRTRAEPGSHYVRHTLAVSELFVSATMAHRGGSAELLAFEPEPACWRSVVDGVGGRTVLKPDAYLRMAAGAYEDSAFIEVDLGTESRPVVARKLRSYVRYFKTGAEQTARGVFPRVLLLTSTEARRAALVELCAALPPEVWQLFTVSTLKRGLGVMTEPLLAEAERSAEAAS